MMGGGRIGKTIFLTVSLLAVLSTASLSSGAEEFKMEGKVIRINGNEVTISDGKGKEQTVESRTAEIKVGDTVTLTTGPLQPALDLKLSLQDIEFLTEQCHVDPSDVDVIPNLLNWWDSFLYIQGKGRKCSLLEPFKGSREYIRKWKLSPKNPPLPPKGYNSRYLTDEEFDYIVNATSRNLNRSFTSVRSHMKGTVTEKNDNQTTINDNKGKQTRFEISDPYIKVGDTVTVHVVIELNKSPQ